MLKGCKTLKAHNSLTAADTLVKLYNFRSARLDLSFEPMVVALSVTVTKFRYYHPGAQKYLDEGSRDLREGVFQIWSNCDEK